VDNTKQSPALISLCSGYGGIERGIAAALRREPRTLALVEGEAFAIANLVAKMEAGEMVPAPIWTDVKTFPSRLFRGRVDILTAGYPCQPFSAAGKRLGTEDSRHLWPYIRQHIRAIEPLYCFFENVEGHISLGLSTVISDLEEDGYRATWGIFSAAEVGAPHQRKRVFILARRKELGDSTGIRLRGLRAVPGKITTDTYGEECRAYESEGTGALSRHESQQEAVADSFSERLEGYSGDEQRAARQGEIGQNRPTAEGGIPLWPARPGEQQYDWEEPRTIKCELGGNITRSASGVDAVANRVDRLRLLGNGVVPQTAAKAWITLFNRLKENEHGES